jgi:ribose transport system ATP-binding protein
MSQAKGEDSELYALELKGVEKSFPGVRALKGASFACRRGEVHVLMGENGAGKSTLMRIIAGVWKPEAGQILVWGREVHIASPKQSQDLGIAMVYQDTRLAPDLDVSQNIWFGREPGNAVLVDRSEMDRGARAIFDRLGVQIALDTPVRDLSVAERQLVEIARALTTEPSVLILDEPTSALDAAEIAHLFTIIDQLKQAGTAVIFISHRLPEVFAIADRITVLKDGEVVGTVNRTDVDHEQLVAMMVGREMALAYPARATVPARECLVVDRLSSPGRFEDVSFQARAGEIVGLGGIQGNGQTDVVRALFGLCGWTGTVTLGGEAFHARSPAHAIKSGLVYVPGERHREGLFLPHSIRENISVPHLFGWAGLWIAPRAREREATRRAIEGFAIKTPSAEQSVRTLSGGNQQKVVLGRWTTGSPRVFVFEDPTRGVDVATKLEIYRRIRALADEGAAVILVASDLLELIGLTRAYRARYCRRRGHGGGDRRQRDRCGHDRRSRLSGSVHQSIRGTGQDAPQPDPRALCRTAAAGRAHSRFVHRHLPRLGLLLLHPQSLEHRGASGAARARGARAILRHPAWRHRPVGRTPYQPRHRDHLLPGCR